jgi:hypothetical protein
MANVGSPQTRYLRNPFDDGAGSISSIILTLTDGATVTQTLRDAIAALPNGGRIIVNAGAFFIDDEILITADRITIEGSGKQASRFYFVPPSSGKAPFSFGKASGVIYQCGLKNLGITSLNTTTNKIAVKLRDVSEFLLEDVAIGPIGAWTGANSIGVQSKGRETSVVNRCSIAADIPFNAARNPDAAGGALLDFDFWSFRDCQFFTGAGKYAMTVDDGTSVTRLLVDHCDFIGGAGGFYWKDTNASPAGIAYNISFRACNTENFAAGGHPDGAWMFYCNTVRGVRQLDLQIHGGAGSNWNGFYIRGAQATTLEGCYWSGWAGSTFVNMDNSDLTIRKCYVNGGTANGLTNMSLVFATSGNPDSTSPHWYNEEWASSTIAASGQHFRVNGVTGAMKKGTNFGIGAGNQISVPDMGGGTPVAQLFFWAHGATVTVAGWAVYFSAGRTAINGLNFADDGSAGKVSLLGSGGAFTLINNTAEVLTNWALEVRMA